MPTNKMHRAVPLSFHRARQLRHEETDAERKLWTQLRAKRFEPIKFRRQFPIGDFIVDFCCKDHKLVIELDGGQHNEPAGIAKDARRTAELERRGYRVMRFWNNEVLKNIDGVVEMIFETLGRNSW